ncbi:MAG: thrombospondin type 3 repeat-containing protein [Deltaproteobacteria bacterium]|nr:thrombospondin type 3 repeat-containing protein [Deltaproteobacteria bacterium]
MPTARLDVAALVISVLALASACGDDVPLDNPAKADVTANADTAAGSVDVAGPQDAADEAGPAVDAVEVTALDTAGVDASAASVPCETNEQCPSGACLPTPEGKLCASPCIDKCPADYDCKPTGGADVQFVCVHQAPYRCAVCKSDAECDGGKNSKKGVCVDLGQGAHCMQDCSDGGACIGAGFQCQKAPGGQQACVPPGGSCPCPEGKVGACAVTNAFGTCKGTHTCSGGKAGACNAPAAVSETCDLQDNDCDGQTDDGVVEAECDLVNVYGTCKGKALCVAGKTLCQGTSAAAEVCNGIDDNCSGTTDEGSVDSDGDQLADCVDKDDDQDGVPDPDDNCPLELNAAQTDTDADKAGDACDDDDDNDKVKDGDDNCPLYVNATQTDTDGDGKGDVCDCDLDGDGAGNSASGCAPDATIDNCLAVANPNQLDTDLDGKGDACDDDDDDDTVKDADDNCPLVANKDQVNTDKGAFGDACDDDDDNDGALDVADNCPLFANPTQTDVDGDKLGDDCDDDLDGDNVANTIDNCPGTPNPDQADANTNKVGDACENDWDSDTVGNDSDNCPWTANTSQADTDADKKGDACDCDADNDGVANLAADCTAPAKADNCTLVANKGQEDLDNDGKGDACDPDKDGDGDPDTLDCKPLDKAISHSAKEACNGNDDDCDGQTDEQDAAGCKPYYYDGDGDGAGVTLVKCLCKAAAPYSATVAGDCNDQNGDIFPAAKEVCANGQDDNCNGSENDENAIDCKIYYLDKDADGAGAATSKCLCTQAGDYTAKVKGDCNDGDAAISPAQTEQCKDGKDNDCNGQTDEAGCKGCTTYYKDGDGDGYGVSSDTKCLSGAGSGYTALKSGDCNDADKAVSPVAIEACNGKDDNCDGGTDEIGATGCKTYYQDEDKDGFGAGAGQCLCKAAGLMTSVTPTDCNDKDLAVNPTKAEVCGNGKDDNCKGGESEENAVSCKAFYLDADGDGVGVATSKCLCAALGQYSATGQGDCNDADKTIAPNQAEKCQDKKDNDCDKLVDEENCQGCVTYYKDVDLDGYGLTADKKCLSEATAPYSASQPGDCADGNKAVNPKAPEVCTTVGVDDDCDGSTDEPGAGQCKNFYTDGDKDTFGVGTAQCLCAATGTTTATKDGDCDDKDGNVNPSKPEVCGNGKDDNCAAGESDTGGQGCVNYYSDGDGDGYGTGTAKCICAPSGAFTAKLGGDCADGDAAINPGQVEKCLDTKDNNCAGGTDEAGCQGCQNYFKDADQDNFGLDADKQCLGKAAYPYTAFVGGDCNDDPAKGGANAKPGAQELCNGIDDNCDGQTDPTGTSGCQNYYPDTDKDGYGAQVSALCLCKASATYAVTVTGDCDDSATTINPKATEVCDGKDNNCNSQVDEGVQKTFYKDEDGDGYGGPTSQIACTAPNGFAASAGDCNDFNKKIYPKAPEVCNDIDDDCDSQIDQGVATQAIYKDEDGDGFAAAGASTQNKCNVPVGWTTAKDINGDKKNDWDCVDSDSAVYPGAPDLCGDGKDNDCNGSADKLCYTACQGSWPFKLQFTTGNSAARWVDTDGDGNYEVVVQDSFGFAILSTTGAPLYNYSKESYNYSRTTATTADVDTYDIYGTGTQKLEIVTGNGSRPRIYKVLDNGTVQVFENATEQVFDATKHLVADINFDGQPELIYQNWCDKTAGTKLFLMDKATGAVNLVSKIPDPDGVCQYYGRTLTDLNGDGVAELLVSNGYPGDGAAVSTATWGGHLFAYKWTDVAKGTVADYCSPAGSCFKTDIASLFGVYGTNSVYRMGNTLVAQMVYSATKVNGQPNATQSQYWTFDLAGKALPGSPTTTVVPNFAPTDVDDDGVVENVGSVQDIGLYDVDGDGYPDQLSTGGSELRLNLWDPVKKAFVEHVPSRLSVSGTNISLRSAWDANGDGTLEVTSADGAGKVYCHTLGPGTWNKTAVLPPHLPMYLRTNQWDNYEPNPGTDNNGDGVPDQVTRVASAMTRRGHFYSYLSSATDQDFYQVDTSWGGGICLQAPKGRAYTLKVYALADRINNTTKVAGADGKPDGLIWTGTTPTGSQVCFTGNSVVPARHGEYRFIVGVSSSVGSSPYWPYWLNINK